MRSTLVRGSEPSYRLQVGASVTRYQSCTVDPRPARVVHCPDLNACLVNEGRDLPVHCNAVHYGYAIPVNVVPFPQDPELAELVLDTERDLTPETVSYLLHHHPQLRGARENKLDTETGEYRDKDITPETVSYLLQHHPQLQEMATTANHRGGHLSSEPEEDIAAIAKQISDHAEAIYQTWKSRGLAPTEILNCHTNSTAADKFGSALTPQREQSASSPVVDLLSTPTSLNTNNLEQLVNNFVVEDKARIARQKTNPAKSIPSSIQFALQKFEKKASEPVKIVPKQINQRQSDPIGRNYSNSTPKPFQPKQSNVSPYIMDTIETTFPDDLDKQKSVKTEEGSSGMTTWPLKNKTVGDTIKKLGVNLESKTESKYSTMPKSSGTEYLDEVAKEEERLINALKTGIIIAEDPSSKRNGGKKTTGLLQKKALKDKPKEVVHLSSNATDVVDFSRKSEEKTELKQVLNKVNVLSKVEAWSKVESQQQQAVVRRSPAVRAPGGSVPHPELRARPANNSVTNPVRPFLTRGSVAERVLIFEKCPTELIMEKRGKGSAVNSWRNTSVDVQAKAQMENTHCCPICQAIFKRRDDLTRHIKTKHVGVKFECRLCDKVFGRKDTMLRHLRSVHTTSQQTPQSPLQVDPSLKVTSPEQPGPSSVDEELDEFLIQYGRFPEELPNINDIVAELLQDEDSSTPYIMPSQQRVRLSCPRCARPFTTELALHHHIKMGKCIDKGAGRPQQTPPPPPPSPPASPAGLVQHGGGTPSASTSSDAEMQTTGQRFCCKSCGRSFSDRRNRNRHQRWSCMGTSSRVASMNTSSPASTSVTKPPLLTGLSPPPSPSSSSNNNTSEEEDDRVLPGDLAPEGFEEFQTGFRGRLKSYRLIREASDHVTIPEFLPLVFDNVVRLMRRTLEYVTSVKINLWLDCEFKNVHEETCRRAFKTKNFAITRATNLEDICAEMFSKLVAEKEACEMKGSGWAFARIVNMEIRVNVYRPLGGSSYIPTPHDIDKKKAVVNVRNRDQNCFKFAVLTRFVHDLTDRQSLTPSAFTPEVCSRANLDFTGLDFPVRLEQIPVFEKRNGVSVNVYGLDTEKKGKKKKNIVYALRVAKEEEMYPDHFDLLFLTNAETTHYAYISNFERLVRSQITQHHGRVYVCKRCFAHFHERPVAMGLGGAQRLHEHRRYCKEHAPLRTDIPEKKEITFDRYQRTQRARFTIYADFESALVPFEEDQPLNPTPTVPAPAWDPATARGELPHHRHHRNATNSKSMNIKSVHKPYAYSYYVRDNQSVTPLAQDGSTFSVLRLYRGENVAQHFMKSIKEDVKHIGEVLYDQQQRAPQLTAQEEASFQMATDCYICKKSFKPSDDKVRDHQHSPPYNYRGAAHRSCNLNFKEQTTVNCYFHNLSNYDAHFIVRELGVDSGKVTVLANSDEKYIAFWKTFAYPGAGRNQGMTLRFVDSCRFLARALADLVSLLPVDQLKTTAAYFPNPEHFELVRRKGVFPYEHVTSVGVLDENVLPPAEAFKNSLTMEDIKEEEYEHAQRVWTAFQCATLGDYADVYLKTDVLLLADVFEGFRDMCLEHYGLDPAHWLTLPSYAWDVMLYKTNVTLDTLQDVDQYLFFEKGIRGGLAQCVTRHAVANNQYIGDRHVNDEEEDFIMYYDANNLYGWAMSQPLPEGEFEWLTREEIDELSIEEIQADGEYGYVLEVDLEYPVDHNLHDRHRDLPFCPEVRRAPTDQLPYSQDIINSSGAGRSPKLMVTLLDKEAYVIHYRLLQQAVENGLRVRQIHRVLRFKQSAWLKPYVTMNTALRQLAKNKFEMELFKLMVNAVYGMSLQNVRKHIDVRMATNPKTYTKYVAKSNFSDRTWYTEDLALLHMAKVRVILEKPVYAGMCILDHSKWWMYRFHYRMQDRYGLNRIRLLYMDTDSLVYLIRTLNVYTDMREHRDDFDTSNYPQDHICYDELNAKVLGKFKDEASGVPIREFIGLMAKLYCFVFGGGDDCPPPVKRAKGVNRAVVKHGLTVEDYRRSLQQQVVKSTQNTRFQSFDHILFTLEVTKRSLAPFDDKRYVMPEDGVNTLPWGHYSIPPPPPPFPSMSPSTPMDE